ncbi:CWF19-like protein 2 homolog [Eumeta japonica]|uniref:CWF19-like protein 2 homolog n=1 Tax=Eumeta variegata TaxID=151549 RepID=A0A4C1VSX5_EUMVA|nr:CWF19-like protein 2 homolog [Eumeta japonica]
MFYVIQTSSSSSDEWAEKESAITKQEKHDDWMSMSGMIKTYTRNDIKQDVEKEKRQIDSYNPASSSRELNPYWKNGGTGLPQTPDSFRKSRPYIKPKDDDDFFSKSSNKKEYNCKEYKDIQNRKDKPNWKQSNENENRIVKYDTPDDSFGQNQNEKAGPSHASMDLKEGVEDKYLTDEKMNKLAAKIVKAEIMGDIQLVNKLKTKLGAAREYRKQNPNLVTDIEEDKNVMLTFTSNSGSTKPLTKSHSGDPRSKGGKRKAETHYHGERAKYFGNDDKYSLAQMFEQEKYSNNYDNEAQLARVASKHKNPNDDLEDIFTEDISKNVNTAKQDEKEKQRAIREHYKVEKSIEGCEYCVGSKNMLKHLMVSCGNKVYVALPSRRSLVQDQCIISTIQHATCVTAIDEDVWEEIMNSANVVSHPLVNDRDLLRRMFNFGCGQSHNCLTKDYRKALTQFFNSKEKDVLFYETATRLHRYPHLIIHCVPMPRDVGDVAAIYFKKALMECEAEWSMNKKVVELKGKNIRKGIPKGLPYFWIDFAMEPGFAHVIEDQHLFPMTFGEEVIGGILDLDHNLWKNPQKENGDQQRKKVLEFISTWKPFDIVNNN